MPVVGFGVFVMMQRQMVGLRERAEGLGVPAPPRSPAPLPTPASPGRDRRRGVTGPTPVGAGA